MHLAGVLGEEALKLIQMTGFERGQLPIRNLGVPLKPGELNAIACDIIIYKITQRVKSWGSKKLSFCKQNSSCKHNLDVHAYFLGINLYSTTSYD